MSDEPKGEKGPIHMTQLEEQAKKLLESRNYVYNLVGGRAEWGDAPTIAGLRQRLEASEAECRRLAQGLQTAVELTSELRLKIARLESENVHLAQRLKGRWVPTRVKMLVTVRPDLPWLIKTPANTIAIFGGIYPVKVNPYGAVSAILPNGELLGLRPNEFEVVECKPEVES